MSFVAHGQIHSPNTRTRESVMLFYVLCPCCESRVDVPDQAVGPNRTQPWNVVLCDVCDAAFDYDDEDVQEAEDDWLTASLSGSES